MRRAALGVMGLLLACGGEASSPPVPPPSGVLEVVLTSGTGTDGAMMFLVQGGPIDSVEAAGYFTVHAPYSSVAERVIVTGTLTDGVLVRVHVADPQRTYTASILEAADATTYALQPLSGYHLTVRPAP